MFSNLFFPLLGILVSFLLANGYFIHPSQPNSNAIICGKQGLFLSVPSSSELSYLAAP